MARPNSWTLPGNGILSGVTFGADQSDADDPSSSGELPWAQAVRQAWESRSRDDSNGSTYMAPSTGRAFDSAPVGSLGFAPLAPTIGSGSGQRSTAPLSFATNMSTVAPALGSINSPPAPLPVSYQWDAAKPWWLPPFPDIWEQWRRGANQSVEPFFRRGYGSGAGAGRGDDRDECDDRLAREEKACFDRQPDMVYGNDFFHACMQRAKDRWLKCLENGRPNGPGEVKQWGEKDEEIWRNYGR